MEVSTLEGTRLGGRYAVHALLGRGGMAEVYDAVDERLGRPVAVKVLRPALAANADVRRRFETEAKAAARLSHPNVVAVYDTGEDNGNPYIVMERLPGETLGDRMAAGPVDEGWLRRVAGDVLQALSAAHGAGIVHRDVKPGNILIATDGCAKVADFGIAKSTEITTEQTATNMLVGTPAYLAPERIEGKAATFRSDIYSLGVVLYEALAGHKPFSGATPLAVAHAIRDGSAPAIGDVRPDVDPDLAAVVTQAMALAPEHRFVSADEMRAALEGGVTVVPDVPMAVTAAGAALAPTAIVESTVAMPAAVAAPPPSRVNGPQRRAIAVLAVGLFVVLLLAALVLGITASSGSGTQSPAGGSSTTATTPPTTDLTTVAPVTTPDTTKPAPAPKKDEHKGHGKRD